MSDEEQISRAERYFDGAMDAAETRAFEAELERSPELQAELEALLGTRNLLRDLVDEQVQAADFSNFFAQIQAGLPAPAPAVVVAAPPAGLGQRVRAWWGRYWTPVLIGAAAATAVTLLVGRLGTPAAVGDEEPVVVGGAVQVDEVNNDGPKTVLISNPVEDDQESGTVIWLLDEEESLNNGAGPAPADGEDPI
jgi:anti-sigma factor RsiW